MVTVVRTAGPHLIEATIIPAVLFYCLLVGVGLGAAYVGALCWSYGALCIRRLRGLPIPPLLTLGVIGITVRTGVAVLSGSSFVYFAQPVGCTVTMGVVFCGSVVVGRPLVGKLAGEFWPMTPEVAARPGVRALFRRLTLLWAGVHFATAAMTLTLLLSLPMATFVAMKQVTGLAITGIGVTLTICLSLATAKREGLASARVAGRAGRAGRAGLGLVDGRPMALEPVAWRPGLLVLDDFEGVLLPAVAIAVLIRL